MTTTIMRNGEVFREDEHGRTVQRPSIAPVGEVPFTALRPAKLPTAPATPPPPVPIARGSATSEAAALAMSTAGAVKLQEARVLAAIVAAGSTGATCDELEKVLSLAHQSASARITGLLSSKAIIRTTRTRKTRTGHAASVLIAAGQSDELFT